MITNEALGSVAVTLIKEKLEAIEHAEETEENAWGGFVK